MPNQKRTHAIVLTRVDYGEADRIITVLTPDVGKLSLIAKGVRKVKSKLAGGIELFSTSEITYIPGRGSVSTLVSARLVRHYGAIIKDIDRTMLGYELLKLLDKSTEDEPEAEYYELLVAAFRALEDAGVPTGLIRAWFSAQLLSLAGHTPNLTTSTEGGKLEPAEAYEFDYDSVSFRVQPGGAFTASQIKFLRLLFSPNEPSTLAKVVGEAGLTAQCGPLVQSLRQIYLRG